MDLKLAEVYKENWPVSEPYRQQFATDSTRCLQIYLTDVRRYFLETKNCCWHLQLRDIQTEKWVCLFLATTSCPVLFFERIVLQVDD